jgi:FAD/FMN-containing dehydrogenase
MTVSRRSLLKQAGAAALLPIASLSNPATALSRSRVRPGDPGWPSKAEWGELNRRVGGRLMKVTSPLEACRAAPESTECAALFKQLTNPYFIHDQAGLTQTLGWVDAWTSQPSVYALLARQTADVVAAVNFAREKNLRLAVRGGGHSYQGTSDAPDSLLIWTHDMDGIALHDSFIAQGCEAKTARPAVSIGAGGIWMHIYDAVMTKGGRYVQGGGCGTVGVAGLIQSGGFGSFSKNFSTAAAGLIEAEIVTADGRVRLANACTNSDLFWGLKGGGGGCLGVITRLTLRTHDLPTYFGAAFGAIKAASGDAFRRLVHRFVDFYAGALFNPHWGESVSIRPDNSLQLHMVFQGLDQRRAENLWQPFLAWVAASPQDYSFAPMPRMMAAPARHFWDPAYMNRMAPGIMVQDERANAPANNFLYAGDRHEAGQFMAGYDSVWLPASLLANDRRSALADALFEGSRHWQIALHFNKGLAGASEANIAAARDTAMNPAVLDAFALAICGANSQGVYPGIAGHEPDLAAGREHANAVKAAMAAMAPLAPAGGSYVSESDYFNAHWQEAFWGSNYPRLAAVKRKYDPDGLFIVHHGVGSEAWSADGFNRIG